MTEKQLARELHIYAQECKSTDINKLNGEKTLICPLETLN